MMKRHARTFSRKLGRKIDAAKSKLDDARTYVSTLGRSNSDYYYPRRTTNVTPSVTTAISDTDDDPVFEGTQDDESSIDDTRRESLTQLPCEFCRRLQSAENLTHHQYVCSENPISERRRRHLTTNSATDGRRPRAISDRPIVPPPVPRRARSPTPTPSAPPRSRSSSPTEGFTVPNELLCPITHSLFHDPVVASDGHTYERAAITDWLKTSRRSPMTRENISIQTLNQNRVIKKMADDFRDECKRKREMYKYKLDVDVKKLEEIQELKGNDRTVYNAEWIKKNLPSADSKIILTHLTGSNAEKLGESICKLGPHPNIVRTFGRVEHSGTGILLLQEYLSEQSLAQLIKITQQKFSIPVLDTIAYQIISALQHLAHNGIVYGNITADNIFVYHFDDIPDNILVKLTNIGDSINEKPGDEVPSEKTDVHAFGLFMLELYGSEIATNDEELLERLKLSERCLVTDSDTRLTFDELANVVNDLIRQKKFIF